MNTTLFLKDQWMWDLLQDNRASKNWRVFYKKDQLHDKPESTLLLI